MHGARAVAIRRRWSHTQLTVRRRDWYRTWRGDRVSFLLGLLLPLLLQPFERALWPSKSAFWLDVLAVPWRPRALIHIPPEVVLAAVLATMAVNAWLLKPWLDWQAGTTVVRPWIKWAMVVLGAAPLAAPHALAGWRRLHDRTPTWALAGRVVEPARLWARSPTRPGGLPRRPSSRGWVVWLVGGNLVVLYCIVIWLVTPAPVVGARRGIVVACVVAVHAGLVACMVQYLGSIAARRWRPAVRWLAVLWLLPTPAPWIALAAVAGYETEGRRARSLTTAAFRRGKDVTRLVAWHGLEVASRKHGEPWWWRTVFGLLIPRSEQNGEVSGGAQRIAAFCRLKVVFLWFDAAALGAVAWISTRAPTSSCRLLAVALVLGLLGLGDLAIGALLALIHLARRLAGRRDRPRPCAVLPGGTFTSVVVFFSGLYGGIALAMGLPQVVGCWIAVPALVCSLALAVTLFAGLVGVKRGSNWSAVDQALWVVLLLVAQGAGTLLAVGGSAAAAPFEGMYRSLVLLAPAATTAVSFALAPWRSLPDPKRLAVARASDVAVALPFGGLLVPGWLRWRLREVPR